MAINNFSQFEGMFFVPFYLKNNQRMFQLTKYTLGISDDAFEYSNGGIKA